MSIKITTDGRAESQQAAREIQSLKFPRVDFNKEDVKTALTYISTQSRELSANHVALRFRLDLAQPNPIHPITIYREVSMTLTDVLLTELLFYISSQTNLAFRIEKGVLIAFPGLPPPEPGPPPGPPHGGWER